MSNTVNRVYNFSAGPSALPLEVLQDAQENLLSYQGMGLSVLEMVHRNESFLKIHREAIQMLRELYSINDDYEVLFCQGGGRMQFAMVPLNLKAFGLGNYCVNGIWSQGAFNEAVQLGGAIKAAYVEKRAPRQDELKLSSDASYLYYCSNETINGIRYNYVPDVSVPLVTDMSSDFVSQKLDISKFGLIFAGAQKNFGPAGLTVVIVRKDLLGKAQANIPTLLKYETYAKNESMYNTPPTFCIYIANLVCHWLIKEGGIEEMERRSLVKSKILYDVIDSSAGFYVNDIEKESRSRMNIVFTLRDESLNQKFLDEAKQKKIVNIKGHRVLGGMRASLYNAVTIEAAEALAEYMTKFAAKYR